MQICRAVVRPCIEYSSSKCIFEFTHRAYVYGARMKLMEKCYISILQT